ncbi:MAG: hypothetical protein OEM39_05450, partial [Acidimicrobiia bacterium]|nr:hypothetical protein [Acidimicrobiia bacterium]
MIAALVGVAMIAVGSLATLYGARLHASTAADAAALAAAVGTYPPAGAGAPTTEARRYALANGAILVDCTCDIDSSMLARTVTVLVEMKVPVPIFGVIPIRAGARAEFDPVLWLGR